MTIVTRCFPSAVTIVAKVAQGKCATGLNDVLLEEGPLKPQSR
jgi:hypothetical protein